VGEHTERAPRDGARRSVINVRSTSSRLTIRATEVLVQFHFCEHRWE
jgi:hypothetical protein